VDAQRTARTTASLRRRALAAAEQQAGVLCRRQLRDVGVPRWLLQLEVRSGRWRRTGRQTVVVHNGPLSAGTRRVITVMEVGRRAALDGVSALQQHGVSTLGDALVHVIAPKGCGPSKPRGAVVHESRRFREQDVVVVGGARTVEPATAAVHAALWASTDRQASLFLLVVVQQRKADARQLAAAVTLVRRHHRRRLLLRVVAEAAGGVQSLGELDVAVAMRQRGLPEPDRQVVRRRPSGVQYLDVRFSRYGVVLEIDGEQHDDVEHRVADTLRDFELVADGDAALRLPLAVWRLATEQVLDRLERVLVSRGWRRAA
jgi:very-short-patch-repair endonuclease